MKRTIRLSVNETHPHLRLDEFLAAHLMWSSRMHIAALTAEGECRVNGEIAHAGRLLSTGDEIIINCDEDAPTAMTPEAIKLEIIHEDESLLVVVKPSGMLMHPTRGVKAGTLANALAYHLNREHLTAADAPAIEARQHAASGLVIPQDKIAVRPGLVHRLDRATSGLVVVAKTQHTLSALSRLFHRRRIEKRYLAVLSGCIADDELVISAPIGRNAAEQPKWKVMPEGKHAESHLRVIARHTDRTLVEFKPLTGRTNQLRIHSSHIGHPIVGDEWYGGHPANRLCLHAAALAFNHPTGGVWTEFASPPPEDMRREWE